MEEKEGLINPGVTVRGDEAPERFRVESRAENCSQYGGSTVPPAAAPPSVTALSSETKKKRGRPRKYAANGGIVALSPMPISASVPLTGDFSSWNHNSGNNSYKKKRNLEFGRERSMALGSGNFIAHVITVNAGEDIMKKIISFSQQGSRAICVLAANGSISNVTLRQPNSSGGTLTYEGRFEILSLTGSFMPNDNGVTRSGGMSVSLAGPDGRILGGGLAGMLVAACPVQIVIGSFIPGIEHEQKPKKPKHEHTITFNHPISDQRYEPNPPSSSTLITPASFRGDNLASVNPNNGFKTTGVENIENSKVPIPNHEITC